MILYNLLFYHIYELALRSKSNRDMPMFITITVINLCFMFNIFSVFLVLEGFGLIGNLFPDETKLVGAIVFIGIVSMYYLFGKRYKRIYEHYKSKRKNSPSTFKAIGIVVMYYLVSGIVLFITALFKNKDWLFNSL